jgi:hypothetical protein
LTSYWPAFAHLGEQAVLQKEIYFNSDSDDDKVFGYQERHAEYRYKQSSIHGKLRSAVSGSLDAWHLSQFLSGPVEVKASFTRPHTINSLRISQIGTNNHITKHMAMFSKRLLKSMTV